MAKSYKKITLIKSLAHRIKNHKLCAKGLGLTGKMHQSRVIEQTPENMGMVNKIGYLLRVEDVTKEEN